MDIFNWTDQYQYEGRSIITEIFFKRIGDKISDRVEYKLYKLDWPISLWKASPQLLKLYPNR